MLVEQQYILSNWFDEFPLGQEDPGERHWLDLSERKMGGNETDVLYRFNNYRYRGIIEPGHGINASFGCSHAMGYGVQTPYAEIIEYANLGISGLSNDGIVRLAYTYCEQFHPEIIVVLWTIPHRREHVSSNGTIVKFKHDRSLWEDQTNFDYLSLQNDKLDEYNLIKNKLFLRSYCTASNIKLVEFEFDQNSNDMLARDKMHPGPDWHAAMSASIIDNITNIESN